MGLFNRSKASENIKKKETFVDNVKDFKSNIVNEESVEQQDLFSNKSTDTISNKSTLGTKRGLSYNFEKIEKKHIKILKECAPESTAAELMKILKRTNKSKFKTGILNPLINSGFFELTIPGTPRSSKQKYRLTKKFINRISKD
jgi:hypothetical protein